MSADVRIWARPGVLDMTIAELIAAPTESPVEKAVRRVRAYGQLLQHREVDPVKAGKTLEAIAEELAASGGSDAAP